MNYHAGMLDQRVSLERRTMTDDGSGGATEAWTEYGEAWAHVRPMSGRERENAQRMEATSNYLVVLRTRSDVREEDRILWRDRYLNVRFVKAIGPRSAFLEVEVELGVAS